jgi:hypothetical protein
MNQGAVRLKNNAIDRQNVFEKTDINLYQHRCSKIYVDTSFIMCKFY